MGFQSPKQKSFAWRPRRSLAFVSTVAVAELLAALLVANSASAQEPPPGTFSPSPPGMNEPGSPGMSPPPMPVHDESPPQAGVGGGAAQAGTFGTPNAKKLRLMKRVSGPECTPEQWQAGSWYKGAHEHNFGWWWIANGTWYSYIKAKAAIPNYDERSIIVYADDKKFVDPKGPLPASVPTSQAAHKTISLFGPQSTSFSSSAPGAPSTSSSTSQSTPANTKPAAPSAPSKSPAAASGWKPPTPPNPAAAWSPPQPPPTHTND